ncbi:acyl carrier protein [Scytonema sp. NUACC21]
MNTQFQEKLLLESSLAQQKQILLIHVQEQLAETLNLPSLTDLDSQQSLIELVNDSLKAVDFKISLETSLGCKLRSTLLFDYPRLNVLVDYLFNEVLQLNSHFENEDSQQDEDDKSNKEEVNFAKEQLLKLSANEIAEMLDKELKDLSLEERL